MNEAKSLDQALAEAFSKADHLQAPLDQRLKLYLGESRKLLPEMEATYDQLVARITANIKDSNRIPGVGEVLPDFCMTDSEGKLVELATLLAKGPLVVSFNRGPWCDYCGLELHSLARAYPEIVAAGGDVIGGFGIDLAHFGMAAGSCRSRRRWWSAETAGSRLASSTPTSVTACAPRMAVRKAAQA